MESFNYFESWNRSLRWASFLPMLLIAYVISFYVGKFVIWWSYGLMGLTESSFIGFLVYNFYSSFACFVISILISVSCAPKGRIIICSLYLGIIILLFGFSIFSFITYGDVNGRPLWQFLYDCILNLAAGIFALVAVVLESKKNEVAETITA